MLPETASLWPLFQLMIRFPGLVPDTTPALASITLCLMLADMTKPQLLDLVAEVVEAQSLREALALIHENDHLTEAAIREAIHYGVGRAQTLRHRYTLVLYWLLRANGAKDFVYEANDVDVAQLAGRYGAEEPLLCEKVEPQKQHIVPYDLLKDLYGLKGRPGRHEAHDIGNLTYISAGLNGFKAGVGARPLRLRAEPRENLQAHMLMNVDSFEEACNPVDQKSGKLDRGVAKERYNDFCRLRRKSIEDRLVEWEEAIRRAGSEYIGQEIDPAARLVNPHIDDVIRSFGYSAPISRCVLELCRRKGTTRPKDERAEIVLKRKTSGRGSRQVLRIGLHGDGERLDVTLRDDRLRVEFGNRFATLRLNPDGTCRIAGEETMAEVLQWTAEQLEADDSRG
jgi:hypothetical protein